MIAALVALKVMTFNAAGIPLIQPRWSRRRQAIAQTLRQSSRDLIALQEVWTEADQRRLIEESGYPYSARGKGGLLLLSRFPITKTHYLSYGCAPRFLSELRYGESLGRKGALMARVKTPQGELDVYDTHFVSDYPGADYSGWRQSQIFEFFEMVENLSRNRPFLVLADVNAGPEDPDYRLLRDLLGLEDVCLKAGKDVCGASNAAVGKRLDHILVPEGPALTFHPRLDFKGPIAGLGIPYSDHKAVSAELDLGIFNRRLRPDLHRQAEALAAMQLKLRLLKKSIREHMGAADWIAIYGFLEERLGEPQLAALEAVENRLDALLIARLARP